MIRLAAADQKIARIFGGLATPPGTCMRVSLMKSIEDIEACYIANFTSHEETPSLLLFAFLGESLCVKQFTNWASPTCE